MRILVVEDNKEVARQIMTNAGRYEPRVDERARTVSVSIAGGAQTLLAVVRALDDEGVELLDVGLRRPTLDDVFLSLTGQRAEVDETDQEVGK